MLRCGRDGAPTAPPVDQCETETDVAAVATQSADARHELDRDEQQDNRAVAPDNRPGALVKLTVPLGEPGSVSALGNRQVLFSPSGFPTVHRRSPRAGGPLHRARAAAHATR